jgi:glycosyltransferase involved in cell wall biosynthesis
MNKTNPKVSIITVTLNNREGLKETLDSIQNQIYKDYEVIVIDGKSTDGTVEYLKKLSDIFYLSEKDSGIYNAMNKGISYAKGEYINFLNSGDSYYSENTLLNIFNISPGEDLLYGDAIISGVESKIKKIKPLDLLFLRDDTICHQSQFIKTNLIRKYNGFNEKFKIGADHDLLLRLVVKHNHNFRYFPIPIVIYDNTGVSSTHQSGIQLQKERIQSYIDNFSELQKNTLKIIENYEEEKRLHFVKNPFYHLLLRYFKLIKSKISY